MTRDLVEDLGAGAPRWLSALCVIVCAIGTTAPVVRWLVTGEADESVLKELRAPADWPEAPDGLADLDTWPDAFGKAFDDRFPFRREFLRLHNLFVWRALDAIADPAMQRGKAGWVYLGGSAMDHYRACDPLEPAELAAWVEAYDGYRDWLAARDVEYVLMFTPDKQGTYPEYLPDWVVPCSERTRTDQFFEALRERSEIEVLDLREAVREAKAEGLTFFQHGTHWNSRGAWPAYVAMAEQLVEKVAGQRVLPRAAFEVVDGTKLDASWYGDSWFERLHVADLIRQEAIQFAYLYEPSWFIAETWQARSGLLDGRSGNSMRELPKAVYVRDSTGDWLWPFFVHHFSELVLESDDRFPAELVEVERPAVVLHTRIERILSEQMERPTYDPREVEVARRWNAAGEPRVLFSARDPEQPLAVPATPGRSWLRLVRATPDGLEQAPGELRVRLAPGTEPVVARFGRGRAFAFVPLHVPAQGGELAESAPGELTLELSDEGAGGSIELSGAVWRYEGP